MKRKGTVVQVTGPVVDVAFDGGSLPEINEALSVAPDGQPRMMEVAQHVGGDTVRCIMLSPSEGIGRGDEVLSTGRTIEAPVTRLKRRSVKRPLDACSTCSVSRSTKRAM